MDDIETDLNSLSTLRQTQDNSIVDSSEAEVYMEEPGVILAESEICPQSSKFLYHLFVIKLGLIGIQIPYQDYRDSNCVYLNNRT